MTETPLKLHLGCWKRYIPGFTHVDLCDLPHIDHKADVASLPMFNDGTAELIYASHVLEYYDREQARQVLTEWRRVLRTGGVLRLAVPDFAILIQVYRKTEDLSKVLGPLYGRMAIETPAKHTVTLYHKTVYDFASLKRILEETGFRQVQRYDWRQTIHKDYDDFSQAYFPHMDKTNGLLISLNVEATKA
jgi:predicted SAM-dependent methyltransferase